MDNAEKDNSNGSDSPSSGGPELWSLWQLLDSILPTGGFAHSYGLEAAVQVRVVPPEDLETYIIQVIENTGSLLLPFVHAASMSPDEQTWRKLDNLLNAMMTNKVARNASMSQGSALMRVAASVFSEAPSLGRMRSAALSSGGASFHHAPIFGLVCGLLGFDTETSQRAYIFITTRDIVSAATRLNLVGPLAAAELQHKVGPVAEEVCRRWMNRSVEEACQTCPLLDIVQGCHSYLFSRLFRS
ncbi:urease accessory protein F [Andrographis paniculata]|uniref:urease accessory protein F n=1 Tax=Andrographis paniculata TaxID=175694 RepID=UPI0021E7AB12|nr:urease accessory protein F [Andrographis paniculata]